MRTRGRLRLVAVAFAALVALSLPAVADAAFAPPGTPGPRLTVAHKRLAKSLRCEGHLAKAGRETVLLIPGTTLNPHVEYSWNWKPALRKLSWPFCSVRLPGNAMGDVQTAAEYVVHAIRAIHRRSGRGVEVLGHSQGGMIGRWALRFWPDTRAKVDDLVGLAPSNHGTEDTAAACAGPGGCAAAFWQQDARARFIAALNSARETFHGVSYTSVYTHDDEVVTPNLDDTGSSSLHGGGGRITNVALQDVCPSDASEHLNIGTADPVAYALAVDAFTHPGPAKPSRIDPAVCSEQYMPGVDASTVASDYATEGEFIAQVIASYPRIPAEPPLRCYVTASCP
jgi:pimeloyl-ACP methyl ester carboxylesterase